MTTGHPNAGYDQLVSRFKLALDNPSGNRTITKTNKDELQEIMAKSKEIWAAKDISGSYFMQKKKNFFFKNFNIFKMNRNNLWQYFSELQP